MENVGQLRVGMKQPQIALYSCDPPHTIFCRADSSGWLPDMFANIVCNLLMLLA